MRQRLRQNAEVVGTDESFFEDDDDRPIVDLYNEHETILDGEDDREVDLASRAWQIWKNAIDGDPSLEKAVQDLPNVVFSARAHVPSPPKPPGAIVYMRTADETDALVWMGEDEKPITQSQFAILQAAECAPETPALPHAENHHRLVRCAVEHVTEEMKTSTTGGQLGPRTGARCRIYERLRAYADSNKGTQFESENLSRAIDDIYRFPLRQAAADSLNRQLRAGANDDTLVQLVLALRDEDRLTYSHDDGPLHEPHIICSMGMRIQ